MGVGESVVNRRKAGGARIGKPRDLYGRRLAGEDQKTIPGHVHGQVDENVDPILAHQADDLIVGQAGDVAPDVGERTEARGGCVRTSNIGVAKNLEVLVIMCREKARHEKRLGVVAKVRRNIADSQPAVERAVVWMRLDQARQRLGKPPAPEPLFLENRPRVVAGTIQQGVEQVAVRIVIVGLQLYGPAEGGNGFVQVSSVLESVAQVVVGPGARRIPFQCLTVTRHGFVQVSTILPNNPQVVVRKRVIGFPLDRSLITRDGLVELSLLLENITQVVVCLGVVGLQLQGADNMPRLRPACPDP